MATKSSSTLSQERSKAKMGVYERLVLFPRLLSIAGQLVSFLVSDTFRSSEDKASNFWRHWKYAQVRAFTDTMSIPATHSIFPGTDSVYLSKCKQHKQKPNTIVLEDGTAAHWIGSSSAKKVVINHHGGGYVLPASKFMMEFMFRLQKLLKDDGADVAILFLSYDLAPEGQYPRQLQQAALLLDHVVNVLKKDPSNIVLTGDSAGGNIVVSLLSHLSHPHPSTKVPIKPIKLEKKLRGVVLVSPWISFSQLPYSFIRNQYKDLITLPTGKKWGEAFMGAEHPFEGITDNYNHAQEAPLSWWDDLQAEEMLILAGRDEVLVDGIIDFAAKLKKVPSLKDRVTFLVAPGEAHDMPSLDLQFGYDKPGQQAKVMRTWISSKL